MSPQAYNNFGQTPWYSFEPQKLCYYMTSSKSSFSTLDGKWQPDACTTLKPFVCYHRGGMLWMWCIFNHTALHYARCFVWLQTRFFYVWLFSNIYIVPGPAREPHPLNSEECGPEWLPNGGNCYKIQFEHVSEPQASQTCQNLGPDTSLLTITSLEEQNFIRGKVNKKLFF